MQKSVCRALLVVVVQLVLSSCSDDAKKGVNEACAHNSDCADNICHLGICVSSRPVGLGQPCSGKGQCRSFNCQQGKCVKGTSKPNTACLYSEECESSICMSGVCSPGSGGDAGLDQGSDAPATRTDAGKTDAGKTDAGPADAAPADAAGGDAAAGDGPGADAATATKLTFSLTSLDSAQAGKHAAIAGDGTLMGIAYFRTLKSPVTVTCPPSTSKPRPGQDLYYVHFNGTSWGTPVKVDQTIGTTWGLSIAFGQSGKVHVGYLGGALNTQECSSSDAVIASSTGGSSWTKQTVATAGPVGDTVGHWISLALDGTGKVHASYRDVNFGYYEMIGNTKASLRYDSEVVVASNGAGTYSSLAFTAAGAPVIAHYNGVQTGSAGGIQLATKSGSVWSTQQLVAGSTSERIDLDTDGKGLFGISYYDSSKQALHYLEAAKNLTGWTSVNVDASTGRKGEHSSLAYDSQGRPGISYHRCSTSAGPTCDPSTDALMFAYRVGGKWLTWEVDTGGAGACGDNTSLVFNKSDEPVIAYRCAVYDATSKTWVDNLKVALGK